MVPVDEQRVAEGVRATLRSQEDSVQRLKQISDGFIDTSAAQPILEHQGTNGVTRIDVKTYVKRTASGIRAD